MAIQTNNEERLDYLQGFRYKMEIAGVGVKIGFSKITGLEAETEVAEFQEGDDINTPRKIPGRQTFPVLSCEKGLDPRGYLHKWYLTINDLSVQSPGSIEDSPVYVSIDPFPVQLGTKPGQSTFRHDIDIYVYDRNGVKSRKWKVKDAFPSKISVGDLDASSSEVVVETIEISHEGLYPEFFI